jgi:simple sugar transport system permease protein
MQPGFEYFCAIVSSTLRMCTPLLYCALAAAICANAKVFNIAMEGVMMGSAFFSIVVNYYTHNAALSVLAGVAIGFALSIIVGFFIIRLKASPVVVGMALNTMMAGVTTYLLYIIFKTKGVFTDPSLVGLHKITLPSAAKWPALAAMLEGLTTIDYLAFGAVGIVYVFLYQTVAGRRLRAIGINDDAARSLGVPVERYQYLTIGFSGILCGLGGVLLSMGSVTLFIQNITSGRGYIAMAANNLGRSHPIGVLVSSLFFGCCQALGSFLQNTSLKGQITGSIPYVATVLALVAFSIQKNRSKRNKIRKALNKHGNRT